MTPVSPITPAQPDRGARYFRADLQVHTPADRRWPGPKARDPDARASLALEYLSAAKQRGIELVGITEHHDVSWIEVLRHAAKRLDMHLLAGFEVETQEGIHVLCLFEPRAPVAALEDALTRLDLSRAQRDAAKATEIRSSLTLRELVRTVQGESGGICIAAHVTSTKGILNTLEGGARADTWKTPELLAAHVPADPALFPHEGTRRILANEDDNFRRDRPLAYIQTSDARSLEDVGTQSVWIKMQRPSVEGLRQASSTRARGSRPTIRTPPARQARSCPSAGREASSTVSRSASAPS